MANISSFIQSMCYTGILDINPQSYDTSEVLITERQHRVRICLYSFFVLGAIALVCFSFVDQDLKRLNFKNSYDDQDDSETTDKIDSAQTEGSADKKKYEPAKGGDDTDY